MGKNSLLKFCMQGKIWICAFKANLPDVTNSKKTHCGQKPHGMHLSLRGRGRENSSQAGNGFQVSLYSSAQLDHYKPVMPGLVVPAVLLFLRDLD